MLDTAGSTLHEWQYNGKGDGVATGAFVRTDALNNVYCASTVDRFDTKGYDIAIVKYDAAGVQQWSVIIHRPFGTTIRLSRWNLTLQAICFYA
ncbi:MAG: hypothetical protein IPP72_16650 [Chitinophagaceae bacterium]|nr:hypothetical protein [Chitinophagaceae bacterium]